MQRFISAVCAGCIALHAAPVIAASAREEMRIDTADTFFEFAQRAREGESVDAVLTENIDLAGSSDNSFEPISAYDATLDGAGHAISGLYIDAEGDGALFLELNGTVKNLTIKGSVSAGNAAAAAVKNNGTISGVRCDAYVYGSASAAGIAGENTGVIAYCENTGNISAANEAAYIAGIAGKNTGDENKSASIEACANFGQIASPGNCTADYIGGICALSENASITASHNVGAVYGRGCLGGIAGKATDSIYTISFSDCINSGDVTGDSRYDAGGIVGFSTQVISSCVNYGEVDNGVDDNNKIFYTGGIAGESGAEIKKSFNYGAVTAHKYVGGIAGITYSNISGSQNHGYISAGSYIGGIAGNTGGRITVSDCSNHGEIHAEKGYAGGIIGNIAANRNTTIERCHNDAVVYGAESGSGNHIGGILGYLEESTDGSTVKISDVYNTADINAPSDSNRGKIAARIRENTTVVGAFSLSEATDHGNFGTGRSSASVQCEYYKNGDSFIDGSSSEAVPAAELAGRLNTLGTTAANRDLWVQSEDGYPVFKSEGEGVINTADKLKTALEDPSVKDIAINSEFTFDSDITLNGDKHITGGRIVFLGGSLIVNGTELTLERTAIGAIENSVIADGSGTVKVIDYADIDAPIYIKSGTLDITDGYLLNKNEAALVPSYILSDGASAVGANGFTYSEAGGGYYHNFPESYYDTAQSLMVPADETKGIPYNIYSSTINGTVYLFLPSTADLSSVTFYELSGGGEQLTLHENVDMTSPIQLAIGGFERDVTAMKSGLPTLHIDINEELGSIDAMNASPDHSVKCYGDARLDVPAELAASRGWKESFVSKDEVAHNAKRDTTLEMKGRGNSTWVPDASTKKPYQIKFEKKVDILNMGKSKTWLLIKNDEDIIRNKLALDLGKDMGLEFTGLGEFVDVFLNGSFLGNYLLTEKVEIGEQRVNITDLDDAFELNGNSIDGLDLTGGYLMESDNWGGDDLQVQGHGTTFSVKEPEDLDVTVTDDNAYAYIKHYLEDFLDAVFSDGKLKDGTNYMGIINSESFAAYFWNQEFLRNDDCGRGSTYFYKDTDTIDRLLYAGPLWDNDRIFEKDDISSNTDDWLIPTIDIAGTEHRTIYNQLIHRREFAELVYRYYKEHNLGETFAGIIPKINEYAQYLSESAAMNSARWGFKEFDISRFNTILQGRVDWVDKNIDTILEYSMAEDIAPLAAYIYDGKLTASVRNSVSEDAINAKLVLAAYENGALIDAKIFDITNLAPDAVANEGLERAIPKNADSLKVMLVNSFDNMKPLCEAVTLRAD